MLTDDVIVEVRDRNLTRLGQITSQDLQLTIAPLSNAVGTWSLILRKDHPLVPALMTPGSGIVVTGPDDVLISGPTNAPESNVTLDDIAGSITFSGVCDNTWIFDRLAYPDPSTSDTMNQATDYDTRTGAAESVMRAYVDHNAGPSAPVDRRVPNLALEADSGLGGSVSKQARFDDLGDLITGIANSEDLRWRVVQRGQQLVFEVRAIQDRSKSIRLDVANGTLDGQRIAITAPTATKVIVGSLDVALDRLFATVTSATADDSETLWGRRIETFMDQAYANDVSTWTQSARELLAEQAGANIAVQATANDDSGLAFGRDWNIGDRVGIVVNGQEVVSVVTGFILKADSSGVKIGAVLGDASGFNPALANAKQIAAMHARVSQLERVPSGETIQAKATAVTAKSTADTAKTTADTATTTATSARTIAKTANDGVTNINTVVLPPIQDTLTTHAGQISTAQSTADTAKAAVDTLNNVTLPDLQASLTDAQGDVSTLTTTTIPALQSDLSAAQADIATAQGSLSDLRVDMDLNSTAVDTLHDVTVPQLQDDLTAAQAEVDTLQNTTVPGIRTDLTAAQSDVATLKNTTVPGIRTDLTAAQGDVATLKNTTVPGIRTDLTTAQGDIATSKTNVTALQGKFPVASTDIKDGSITTPKMVANSISGDRITANTLDAAKIVAGSITSDRMTANSITGDRIQANTLGADRIVAGSITSDRMTADSITGDRIKANTLDAAKITVGSITSDRMTVNTITGDRILANSLDAGKIVAGSITTDRMTAGSINGDRISANTLDAAKIIAGSITTDRMTANSISGDRISAGTLDAAKIVAGSITTDRMTANTISGDRIAANTLDAAKIVAGSITTDRLAAGAITADKLDANAINGKTITGVTITGANITGTTSITGASIKTSATGARTEIGSSQFATSIGLFSGASGETTAGSISAGNLLNQGYLSIAATKNGNLGQAGIVLQDARITFSGASTFSDGLTVQNGLSVTQGFSLTGGGTISGATTFVNAINGQAVNAANGVNVTGSGNSVNIASAPTQTSSANVFIGAGGTLNKVTSLRKYKVDIEPIEADTARRLLDVQVSSWFDKSEYDANGDSSDGLRRVPGVIAEDVYDAAPIFNQYDEAGEINGVAYDRIGVAWIPLVRELMDRVSELEAQLSSDRS